jgi:dihydroflavonol-4-reductase
MHSKTLAEDEVRAGIARGLDASIMNPTHVIGRYDKNNWARLILLAAEGKLRGIPPGGGSFCHGTEVARAHISAVTRGRTGENYLLGGADASFPEVVALVSELIGRRIDCGTVPAPVLLAAGRTFDFISRFTGKEPIITRESAALLTAKESVRSNKAICELGYRAVPLREMLQDCCDWLVAEKLLKLKS